jgi:hypothetical protein
MCYVVFTSLIGLRKNYTILWQQTSSFSTITPGFMGDIDISKSNLKIFGTMSQILRNLQSQYNKKDYCNQYWSELWMVISKLLLAIGGFALAKHRDRKRSLVT